MTTSTAVATKADAAKPALKAGSGVSAIVPQDAEQAWRMAQMICMSPMAPKGMDKPEYVVIAILHGLEVGLKPMQAVQSIAVVNGRPVIWGDAALGLVQGSGLVDDIEERIEGTGENMVAICRAQRKGNASPVERRFSVADAKRAGLWSKAGPWTQYPQRMLQMRARSWCIRDGFPDVLKGLQVREEVRDFVAPTAAAEPPPPVTAATIKAQRPEPENVTDAEFTAVDDAGQDAPQPEDLDEAWERFRDGWKASIEECTTLEALAELEKDWQGYVKEPPGEAPPEMLRRQMSTAFIEARQRLEKVRGKR